MCIRRNIAVSEVLSLILVFTIVSTSVSFIVFWGTPQMEIEKARNRMESAKTQFIMISEVIKNDVVGQGFNSSTVVGFTTDAGEISISNLARFIFYYSLNESIDFYATGLDENPCTKITIKVYPEAGQMNNGKAEIFYINTGATSEVDWNAYDDGLGYFDTPVLSDAVKINIKNEEGNILGRIWLFDIGYISYNTPSPSGVYRVITGNGGVVAGKDQEGYLWDKPNVKVSNNSLSMRIIQFKSGQFTGGSGGGNYQFSIKLNSTFSQIIENRAYIIGDFKMQIYGDPALLMAWKNYFKLEQGFEEYEMGDATGTIFLAGDRFFSLVYSFCDVELKAGVV